MRRYQCNLTLFVLLLTTPILLHRILTVVTVMAFHPLFASGPSSRSIAEISPRQEPHQFRPLSSISSSPNDSTSTGVESLSLDIFGNDHEQVGDEIATSVQAMLDTEWMPQNIHYKMGQSVKQSYIKVRSTSSLTTEKGNNNDDVIMTIMTTVADDLIANWKEYDKDAFVNAWDIANYVSDYLTTKINGDACGCSSKIY